MRPNMKSHFIISGVGRSGTTFLVSLLTRLGLDTGFEISNLESEIDQKSRGGLEHNLLKKEDECPYVVKNPWLCLHIEEIIKRETVSIDHVLIPIRALYDCAESRRRASEKKAISGGLWGTESYEKGVQESILAKNLYNLIHILVKNNIPFSFIEYPNFIYDPKYLYNNIPILFDNIPFNNFKKAFDLIYESDSENEIYS